MVIFTIVERHACINHVDFIELKRGEKNQHEFITKKQLELPLALQPIQPDSQPFADDQ